MSLWWIVVLVVVGAAIWLYNSLVALRNQVRNAWSQIDVQLKRRHDLIPTWSAR
jgi:LemA protein